MGALMRSLDWSTTALGPVSAWPQSLLTSVSTCLDCAFPILIWWGPELVMLYNDEYRHILGPEKHPAALGAPGRDVWPELWDVIGPMLNQVVTAGQATRSRDLLLVMNRRGCQEETYFSFSYSPIRDETGGVGGVFTPVIETTGRVIGERRLRTLRELAAASSATVEDVLQVALDTLSHNDRDAPFALIYCLDDDDAAFRLAGAVGLERGSRAAPEVQSREDEDAVWPLHAAVLGGDAMLVEPLDHLDIPLDDGRLSPDRVLIIPIAPAGREKARTVLIVGINPLRPLDDEHRAFFDLVAGQIGQSLADALALEEERRRAAAAGHEYARTLRLLEQAPSFICVLRGPDHVFEFANAAYRRIVGERDIIGRTVRAALPEVVEQGFIDFLDRVYAGERIVGQAMPMWLQTGPGAAPVRSFIDFIYEPIVEADGTISGIFVEGYEVTERVLAEQALRGSEEQLRLATEAAEVGLWDVDGATNALYWPARVKAMFGISPDRPITMDDFFMGLHPEDREATTAAYEAAIDPARRALYDVEYRTVGKEDGVVRWVAAKGRGVFDDEGRCVRVIGTAIDITRRKQDEARLRELNETLERRVSEALAERKVLADIVEGTDAFVQVADLDYRWIAINKASADEFEKIFGKRPRPGDNMLDQLADRPEQAAAVKAVWSRALAGEEFTQIDAFGDPGLHRRFYEMKFNTLRDQTGRRIGAYQFVYDVTERMRDQARLAEAEAALRQAQKLDAMGQLTGGVAHDFNNLLTPIIGALDLLDRRKVGGEREQRLIAGALQSGERAKTLVQRLLAFARRQPLQASAIDIRGVVEGMADLIGSTIGPHIEVVLDVPADLPPAMADANQLEMALLNLSVNARDAMEPGGGTLRISADVREVAPGPDAKLRPGRYVRISVADTGVGMSEEVIEKAVEPFFSTKGIGKGTGLGLSMVHGLATQLGGALTIESRPGQGTTVELWLPLSDQPLAANTTDAAKPWVARNGAARALLVDDEDLVRASAADMLTELGFDVVEASTAEEALDLLERGQPVDVLITDHLMPGMNGAALAYEVKKRWPLVRSVVISGYAETEGIGPDLLRLNKPFRQSELAEALSDQP